MKIEYRSVRELNSQTGKLDLRATLAIVRDVDADGGVYVGTAFCSDEDRFSRKRGQLIAGSRVKTLRAFVATANQKPVSGTYFFKSEELFQSFTKACRNNVRKTFKDLGLFKDKAGSSKS